MSHSLADRKLQNRITDYDSSSFFSKGGAVVLNGSDVRVLAGVGSDDGSHLEDHKDGRQKR